MDKSRDKRIQPKLFSDIMQMLPLIIDIETYQEKL